MSKNKVLLKFEDNWADEMDICSWQIVDKAAFESIRDSFILKYEDREFNIGIGSNEDIEYDNAKAFLEKIDVTDITDEEVKTIKKLFKTLAMSDPVDILETLTYLVEEVDEDIDDE